jgi:hypothetical protein
MLKKKNTMGGNDDPLSTATRSESTFASRPESISPKHGGRERK